MESNPTYKSVYRLSSVLIICIHLVLLVYQWINKHAYTIDSYEYLFLAKNILTEGQFYAADLSKAIDIDYFTKILPLYPLFLIIVSFGSFSLESIIFAQTLVSLLTLFLFEKYFLRDRINAKQLALFSLFIIITPSYFIYSKMVMSETLLLLFIVLFMIGYDKINTKTSLLKLNLNGFSLITLFLTKPVFYLFFPIYSIFLYLKTKNIKKVSIVIGLILFCLLTYMGYNYHRTDYFHFSSIQRMGFVSFNTFYYQIQELGFEEAHTYTDSLHALAKSNFPNDYKAYTSFLMDKSIAFCLQHPVNYSIYYAKGILVFFLDPGRFDIYNFLGWDKWGQDGLMTLIRTEGFSGIFSYLKQQPLPVLIFLSGVLFANLIKLIGFIIYLFGFKSLKLIDFFMISIILYVAILTGPLGAARYSLPIQFMLIYCSIIGFSRLAFLKAFTSSEN